MFMEKNSIICSFKFVTIAFIFYMLTTGVIHLRKDFDNDTMEDIEIETFQTTTIQDIDCKTPIFLISFAFVLGAFWNQNKILKFGVI